MLVAPDSFFNQCYLRKCTKSAISYSIVQWSRHRTSNLATQVRFAGHKPANQAVRAFRVDRLVAILLGCGKGKPATKRNMLECWFIEKMWAWRPSICLRPLQIMGLQFTFSGTHIPFAEVHVSFQLMLASLSFNHLFCLQTKCCRPDWIRSFCVSVVTSCVGIVFHLRSGCWNFGARFRSAVIYFMGAPSGKRDVALYLSLSLSLSLSFVCFLCQDIYDLLCASCNHHNKSQGSPITSKGRRGVAVFYYYKDFITQCWLWLKYIILKI